MVQVLHPPHNFDFQHFKVVEAMVLKVVALRSPAMVSPPYKISPKSVNWSESYWGDTQTDTHAHTVK
jgi:hypothetical protein